MKFEIKRQWSGNVLFSIETRSLRLAVEAAVNQSADLSGADLSGADLIGADLRNADLSGADLSGADLSGADLSGADLRNADLRNADLRNADLRNADLRNADLRNADLSGADLRNADLRNADLRNADLSGAVLRNADLSGAVLIGAVLTPIKHDLWAALLAQPAEIAGLRQAITEGRVDGSQYSGACACLVGTIANTAGCAYNKLPKLKPDAERPAERFFLAIKPGDTPETSQLAKLAVEWIDELTTAANLIPKA
jgi:hypothetical protein